MPEFPVFTDRLRYGRDPPRRFGWFRRAITAALATLLAIVGKLVYELTGFGDD